MRQWLPFFATVLMQGESFAWRAQHPLPDLESPPSIHFPLNETQAWFVKPTYLFWKPFQDGTDYGRKQVITEVTPSLPQSTQTNKNLEFNWGSGVKIGVGRYLPEYEQWDVTLFGTYFYGSGQKKIRGKYVEPGPIFVAGDELLFNAWDSFLIHAFPGGTNGTIIKSHIQWHVNYFVADALVGRHYLLTNTVDLHPFIGIRACWIEQEYFDHDTLQQRSQSNQIFFTPADFKASNNFWGMGARVGSDFAYSFGKGWSWTGSLSSSLVMSRYKIKEKITSRDARLLPSLLKVKDGDTALRTNLEVSVGFGWEKWVSDHSIRIASSILFDMVEWYSINQWIGELGRASVYFTGDDALTSVRRKQRDLGFYGFSANLQIDF